MKLILASTSPYRLELLQRFGIPFEAVAHRCDEDVEMTSGKPADEVAATLARAKAESLDHDAYILGSDQVVEHEGEILGKAGTMEGARAQLRRLSGSTHRLITAVALRHPNGAPRLVDEAVAVCRMTMRALSDEEIARYVKAESPVDCCGAYKIESRGIALFDRIECDDFTAITGLPLMRVGSMLRAVGFEVP